MTTIAEVMYEVGLGLIYIKAVKSGYEGILWDAPVEEFVADFYGRDILAKARMFQSGDYPSWSVDMERSPRIAAMLAATVKRVWM